jgi:hypothetical protein
MAVANQTGSDRLSDLLREALHGFHCIAARSEDGRRVGEKQVGFFFIPRQS